MENCSSGQLRLLLLLWNWDSRRRSAGQWTPPGATTCDLLQLFVLTSTCTEQWAFAVPLTLCVLHFVFRISVLLMGCWSVLANSITSDYCVTITHMFDVIMIWYWGIWCLDKFTKIGSQVKSLTFGSTQLSYWLLKQIRIALHVSSTLDNECFNLVPKVGIL